MNSNLALIKTLFSHFEISRKIQFIFLICLMVVSSLADVISIGAVLPFLAVLTAPEIMLDNEVIGPFFKYFGYETADELIAPLTVAFLLSVIISSLLRIAQLIFNTKMAFSAGSEISIKVFQSSLSQDFIKHKITNSNETLSVITTKIEDVIYRTIQPALQLISASLLILFIISFLMLLNPGMVLISFSTLALVYILISIFCYKLLRSDSENISVKRDDILRISNESFSSIRDIIINKSYRIYEQRYNSIDISLRKSQAAIIILSNLPRYLLEAVGIITIVSIAFFFSSGTSGFAVIAMLGAIAMAAQRLLPAFQQVYGSWATITGNIAPLEDVVKILENNLAELKNNNVNSGDLSINKEIRLDGLTFGYPGESLNAIEDISIIIPKNHCVAFVGSTGCGKSTLMDAVLGLLHPDKGTLWLDDMPVDSKSAIDLWHSIISHVPQSVYLTDSTIADNITQHNSYEDIDKSLLVRSAKDALILDFIESLPEKFDSIAGENGSNLSGGQKQRIGIARSLYKQSPVIILDEATSALDNLTESKIIENILKDKEKTILMVSHSIHSVKKCDLIFEMHEGSIKSFGTYEELIKKSNSFKKLTQMD